MKRIYFDMDGVIADFIPMYTNMYGNIEDNPIDNIWDIIVKDEFYKNLPILKSGMDLLKYTITLAKVVEVEVEILSSCGGGNTQLEIEQQKKIWLDKVGLRNVPVNFTTSSKEKSKYANTNTMLIDDRDKSNIPFSMEGGYAVKFTPENINSIKNKIYNFIRN